MDGIPLFWQSRMYYIMLMILPWWTSYPRRKLFEPIHLIHSGWDGRYRINPKKIESMKTTSGTLHFTIWSIVIFSRGFLFLTWRYFGYLLHLKKPNGYWISILLLYSRYYSYFDLLHDFLPLYRKLERDLLIFRKSILAFFSRISLYYFALD